MQYNSWLYLFPFLGGSIILYYLIPVKRRWIGLLFSSLLFYILAMKNLVAVVLFTTATIYLGARTIEEFNEQFKLKKKELDRAARKELKSKITKKNRYVIALLCVINFGILFITKYFNFFGENINTLFHALHISAQIPFLDIFLPLGISFYTLSAISYITALETTCRTLNFNAIPEVVDYILNSKTINLFGFGGSGTSANEFKNKFMKIMPNVIYNADAHIQLTQAALLGNDDLAIIFCNSGITKDCIEIAKICYSSGATVVFITKFAKTPAAQYSTVVLLCGANEGPMEGGSIATKTAQLFLIDLLYAEVYKTLGKKALDNKQKTAQIITEKMM